MVLVLVFSAVGRRKVFFWFWNEEKFSKTEEFKKWGLFNSLKDVEVGSDWQN